MTKRPLIAHQLCYLYCSRRFSGQVIQFADTPTRGLPTRGLDKSRTGHDMMDYINVRPKAAE